MDILQTLKGSIQDRFKANAVIEQLKELIREIAIRKTYEKYKDRKLLCDGIEYELIAVKASAYIYGHVIDPVKIRLGYFVTEKTKLPKDKREKIEQVKKDFEKSDFYLCWNNYKTPLWKSLDYDIALEKVLSGEINLNIA